MVKALIIGCGNIGGLSDHTLGIGVALGSVSFGARVIEKHFTIDRSQGGVDSAFSLEPTEFKMLVEESERAFLAIGKVTYGIMDAELNSKKFKRSIYIVKDLKKGDVITAENIRIIRPGLGLSPKYFDLLLGKRVKQNINRGTAFTFNLI